jgi:hypothetical protein
MSRGQSAEFMAKIRKMRKGAKRKVYKVKSYVNSMARRKKSKHYGRLIGKSQNIMNILAGSGAFLLYKIYLAPKVPLTSPMINVVELVAGYFLSKKKGIVGAIGNTAMIISAYELMIMYVAPILVKAPTTTSALQGYY